MNQIVVIITYFGKFKPSFKLFYESCRRNPKVDWFIFTDAKEPDSPSENVKWIDFTLEKFNALATLKLGEKVDLHYAYKLCDFKPMYGLIFEDFIGKGYKYWAFGDVDVIYGDISGYLKKIDYEKYDKINFAGHFCLMRNDSSMANLFKQKVEGTADFKEILNFKNIAFDERDFNKKVLALNKKVYNGIFVADIVHEKGMQCVDKKMVKNAFGIKNIVVPKNYRYQLFVSEQDKIYRYYKQFGKIKRDEFCYIHFRKETPINLKVASSTTYIISGKGFFDVETLDLNNKASFMNLVDLYNHRNTFIKDKINALKYYCNKIFCRNKEKI